MPSTHTSLHYHLVWSTKDRVNLIAPSWRSRLHAWLGGNIRAQNGVAVLVGGVGDHVHLLIGLRATHCLADVVRISKSESSEWVHNEIRLGNFAWQEGYGAFTVSPTQLDVVRHYIANQEDHHHIKTFQEEYLEMLQRAEIQYDEKYLW